MPHEAHFIYEFDEFKLVPSERLLLRGGKRVNLTGKDFDVLVYLVKKRNQLISVNELFNELWKDVSIEDGNITNNVSKIRKALGDSARHPKFIETVPGHGYRFIAAVTLIPYLESVEKTKQRRNTDIYFIQNSAESERETFQVESHKFVPVLMEQECYAELEDVNIKESQWAKYKEINTEVGRFCLLPFGVGVWHLVEVKNFATLTDLAVWRRETYRIIKSEEHQISVYANELCKTSNRKYHLIWQSKMGKPGYVLSLMVLKRPLWGTQEHINTALKILACPRPLSENVTDLKQNRSIDLEGNFLKEGFFSQDMKEFGLPGSELGFACWSGVSYYQFDSHRNNLTNQIVEFEIALQATWWFCDCLYEICKSNGENTKSKISNNIQFLIKQFAKLKSIGATETISQRTMCEAIMVTSRLEEKVQDTIDLFNHLQSISRI